MNAEQPEAPEDQDNQQHQRPMMPLPLPPAHEQREQEEQQPIEEESAEGGEDEEGSEEGAGGQMEGTDEDEDEEEDNEEAAAAGGNMSAEEVELRVILDRVKSSFRDDLSKIWGQFSSRVEQLQTDMLRRLRAAERQVEEEADKSRAVEARLAALRAQLPTLHLVAAANQPPLREAPQGVARGAREGEGGR